MSSSAASQRSRRRSAPQICFPLRWRDRLHQWHPPSRSCTPVGHVLPHRYVLDNACIRFITSFILIERKGGPGRSVGWRPAPQRTCMQKAPLPWTQLEPADAQSRDCVARKAESSDRTRFVGIPILIREHSYLSCPVPTHTYTQYTQLVVHTNSLQQFSVCSHPKLSRLPFRW